MYKDVFGCVKYHSITDVLLDLRLPFNTTIGIITSAKEVMFSLCLFVCTTLLATLLKKFLTDFHEIFRIGRQWYKEQLIKFWGVPDHPSDAVKEMWNAAFLTIPYGGIERPTTRSGVTESRDVHCHVSGTRRKQGHVTKLLPAAVIIKLCAAGKPFSAGIRWSVFD